MTLYDLLTAEIEVSEHVIADGEQLIPRFRILSPEGQFVILMDLAPDANERERRLTLVARFMTLKMAFGFVLSTETQTPEAITSFVAMRNGCGGLTRRVFRVPTLSFGPLEELGPEDVGDDLLCLLPQRESAMTSEQVREVERAFGPNGEMPAERL